MRHKMLADRYLPIVMQFCYFLGHKNDIDAKNFGISKDWLHFDNNSVKITGNGEKLAMSLLDQNGTRSSFNSF